MREKLERAPDNLAPEQAIMGQPQNKRQDANDDRSAIKDQAIIQMLPRIGCSGPFIDSPLPKRELPTGQIHRDGHHGKINASDCEPSAVIVGCEIDGQGKQERDQEIFAKEQARIPPRRLRGKGLWGPGMEN